MKLKEALDIHRGIAIVREAFNLTEESVEKLDRLQHYVEMVINCEIFKLANKKESME